MSIGIPRFLPPQASNAHTAADFQDLAKAGLRRRVANANTRVAK